ncbi:MAG: hypothetical protein JNJ95_00760 [Dechloromonas sp.]|nr:hypothetical protein [Dechloromonas sp.]
MLTFINEQLIKLFNFTLRFFKGILNFLLRIDYPIKCNKPSICLFSKSSIGAKLTSQPLQPYQGVFNRTQQIKTTGSICLDSSRKI